MYIIKDGEKNTTKIFRVFDNWYKKNSIKTGFFLWTITKHKKFLCDEDLMILKNWTTCKEKNPKSHVILLTTNKIYNKINELKKAVNFSG